jgi:mRNA-degrading endonuclease RelE of RelBE toxin-antitoxin system
MAYKVIDNDGGFVRAVKKFKKNRQSEKNKPDDILKQAIDALKDNPKNGNPPFKMHPINKYKAINLWGMSIYDRHGDRMIYTVDDKTKTVMLINIGAHDTIYESLEALEAAV